MNIPPSALSNPQVLNSVGPEEPAPPIFYDARIHGEIDGFINSDLGQRCKNEMIRLVSNLTIFCFSKGCFFSEDEAVKTIAANQFWQFSERVAALDGKGIDSRDFLSFGKRALQELSEQIENDNIALDLKLSVLVELSRSLTVCAPGVITAIRDAVLNLTLMPDLKGALGKLRNQVAVQAVQSEVAKWINDDQIPAGNEVHYVNACLSVFATRFKLDVFEDSLAPFSLPQECLGPIEFELTNLLEDGALLIKFSDDYQALVATLLYGSLNQPVGSDLHSNDYPALKAKVDDFLHQESSRHGFYIEPEALFEFMGTDGVSFCMASRSNKILQKLVVLCKQQQLFDEAPVKMLEVTTAEGKGLAEPLSLCCMGDREWVETGNRLPDSEHREHVRNIELHDRFWLFDQIAEGQTSSLEFSQRISDLFTSLTSAEDVYALATYFSQRLHALKLQSAETAGQAHELVCKQLLRDSSFNFKQQFLGSQLLHWSTETLFYCFDDKNLYCHLVTALNTGFSPSLVSKNGYSFLQCAAKKGFFTLFDHVIASFDCNPFLINPHGTAFSEHANLQWLQTFLFGPPLGKPLERLQGKLQYYLDCALLWSPRELHPKILSEAGLFLAEGQTLIYNDSPNTSRQLLQHAFDLSFGNPNASGYGQVALYRSAHLLIAKGFDSMHPLAISNTHVFADRLWAYQKMSASFPLFAFAKMYKYFLSSELHHPYEQKHGLFSSSDMQRVQACFRETHGSVHGSTDLALLLNSAAILNDSLHGGCSLSFVQLQSLSTNVRQLVIKQPTNQYLRTIFCHLRLLYEEIISADSSQEVKGMSKDMMQTLKETLSLDYGNAHAWLLLAKYLNADQTLQINNETLGPADCELRSYAYTPINLDSGDTIMHTVAKNRDLDTFRRLQQFGCDIKIKNRAGKTPMDIVVGQVDRDFANLMIL